MAASTSRLATSTNDDEEEKMVCPYVSSHKLQRGTRFQKHLIKCRKEALGNPRLPWHQKAKQIIICPYDQTHHIKESLMIDHLKECEAAKLAKKIARDFKLYDEADIPEWKKHTAPINGASSETHVGTEEDWDADVKTTTGYDPSFKLESGNYILKKHGLKPAERRQFRKEEEMKWAKRESMSSKKKSLPKKQK